MGFGVQHYLRDFSCSGIDERDPIPPGVILVLVDSSYFVSQLSLG